MAYQFANNGDPDQMPQNAASDLGLHCLAITVLGFLDYNEVCRVLTLVLLNPDMSCLCKQCKSRSVGF